MLDSETMGVQHLDPGDQTYTPRATERTLDKEDRIDAVPWIPKESWALIPLRPEDAKYWRPML